MVYLAICLRNDGKYSRFLKYLNFGLMYNIGFGAIRAEARSTRQVSFIEQWSRGDIFQNKVSFTLIIWFLYHHLRVGRRASIPVQPQAPLVIHKPKTGQYASVEQ